jgi:TetR/AcrR family transcriptional regulator, cholesterol catabolism regulator
VQAAARLFSEKGYDATTVRDIAEAVQLQSGSLFFHFSSKEEILLSVLEHGTHRALEILDRYLEAAKTPEEKLSAVLHGHLKALLEEERNAFTVVLYDWRTLSPATRREVVAMRDEYESHLGRALDEVAQGGLIQGDTHLFRLFLLGALNWTIRWYKPGGDLTVDELADHFLALLLPNHLTVKPRAKQPAKKKK